MAKIVNKPPSVRLCVKCGEVVDVKNPRADMCSVCTQQVKLEAMPEPEDIGSHMCWHDHIEVKKHHCKSRREVAKRFHASGKKPQMPQCLVCGTQKKYMPYECDPDADYLDSAICKGCNVEFRRKSHNKQLCPKCTKANEKASSDKAYEKKFGVKKKCQKNTNMGAGVQTASSIPQTEVSQITLSAPASAPCPTSSSTESSNPSTVESMSSSS